MKTICNDIFNSFSLKITKSASVVYISEKPTHRSMFQGLASTCTAIITKLDAIILKSTERKPRLHSRVVHVGGCRGARWKTGSRNPPRGRRVYNEPAAPALLVRLPCDSSRLIFRLSKQTRHTSSGGVSPVLSEKNDALSHGGERTPPFSRLPDLF